MIFAGEPVTHLHADFYLPAIAPKGYPVLIDEETLPRQPHQSVRILGTLSPPEYGIATRECMRNSSEYKAATMDVYPQKQ